MGYWSIVVPEGTTNLVANPSVETNAAGYAAAGSSSLERVTTQQRRGVYSLRVTPTNAHYDGVYYSIALGTSTTYTFSVDVLGADGVPYRIYIYDATAGTILGSPATFTGDGQWHRYTVTATTGVNPSCRLYVTKNNSNSTTPFYVDGFQCEAKAYATSYVDGDQDGCKWTGAAHASTSTRDNQYRLGGREYDFSSLGINVLDFTGTGMPPLQHITHSQAQLPGLIYRATKVHERAINLMFLARGDSISSLHRLRKQLIDVIKPDLVAPHQPFLLRYSGAGATLEIPVVYDTGLEQGEWEGFNERMVVRCIAYDQPYWAEDGERGIACSTIRSLTLNGVAGRIDGRWTNLNGGLTGGSGVIHAMVIGADGTLYVGGAFSQIGGVPANNIARWDGVAWSALGSGTNSAVRALAIGIDGTLYAGGQFTVAGNISVNRIAKWDGVAWSALGSGVGGVLSAVYALAIGIDGTLYVGGTFSTAGGVSAKNIAKWDETTDTWSALGSGVYGGSIEDVDDLAVGPDGSLYVTGRFTTAGGVTVNNVAKWNGTTWSALGNGISGGSPTTIGRALTVATDGTVFLAGAFTMAGGVAVNNIAKWNGTTWSALGSGMNDEVYDLAIGADGILYAGGLFTSAGGLILGDRVAKWDGTIWSAIDIDLPGAACVMKIATYGANLYLSFNTFGTGTTSDSISTIEAAVGTATTYPVITIKRVGGTSATLQQITNITTKKTLCFNCPLADGESVIIDLRPGRRSVTSSYFGNVLNRVLANSDLATFALQPGRNEIQFYVPSSGSPTVTCTMRWKVLHWSVDGVAQ